MRNPSLIVVAVLVAGLALASCSDDAPTDTETTRPSVSSGTGVPPLTVSALPEPPPTGELIADLRQSSRDAAAGRMQVWIDNDTLQDVIPTRMTYADARFQTVLEGDRLREIPAQSTRGFQFVLPGRPTCGTSNDAVVSLDDPLGTVTVELADGPQTLPVADETDVAGRFTRARCLEISVDTVARLSWSDQVTDGDPTATPVGGEAVLELVLESSGSGGELVIDTVSGTPILSPVGTDAWRPAYPVTNDGSTQRVRLPLKPTRCDAHAFAESGGATAFKIGLHLEGQPGQITLRMSPAGAANAINFARASCGLLETVGGTGRG